MSEEHAKIYSNQMWRIAQVSLICAIIMQMRGESMAAGIFALGATIFTGISGYMIIDAIRFRPAPPRKP